ncbi:three-Cys-motif partner protein TcmP [bacterium]|nr:three-Cys-motif partner protein TcmP [bacterium]
MGDYKKFGGEWTEAKLRVLEKYVRAYLTIMRKRKFETVYIDGFAGYCKLENETPEEKTLFHDISETSNRVYEGSVYRILKISLLNPELSFSRYVFIDQNRDYLDRIKEIMNKEGLNIDNSKVSFLHHDCNFALTEILKVLNNPSIRGFIHLDPYGMSLNWETLKGLETTSSDLWVLIPSGVAINRLLTIDKIPKAGFLKKLTSFFGVDEEEIIQTFYEEKRAHTLFGQEKSYRKYSDNISRIIDLYSRKLHSIGYKVSIPLELRNKRNAPIFHFLAASRNNVAIKIADDIIRKEKEERQDGLF